MNKEKSRNATAAYSSDDVTPEVFKANLGAVSACEVVAVADWVVQP